MRTQAFYGERPAHTHGSFVFVRLVEQGFGVGVFANGDVDLGAGHAFLDVGIVRDALQRDVRYRFVNEPGLDVAARQCRIGGKRLPGKIDLFLAAFGRIGKQVVWKLRGHQPRPRQCERHAGRINRNPASAPLFGNVRRRTRTAIMNGTCLCDEGMNAIDFQIVDLFIRLRSFDTHQRLGVLVLVRENDIANRKSIRTNPLFRWLVFENGLPGFVPNLFDDTIEVACDLDGVVNRRIARPR